MYRVAKTTDEQMWEFQSHFRASAQTLADEIFDLLDPNLRPQFSLIGVHLDDQSIIVDAGDRTFVSQSFRIPQEILSDHEWKVEAGRGSHKLLSHLSPHSLDSVASAHRLRNILLTNLRQNDPDIDRVSFCGYPVQLNGYVVTPLLQFSRTPYLSYSGDESTSNVVDDLTYSLLNPLILEFLNIVSFVLTESEPGSRVPLVGREGPEFIRAAANTLMFKLTYLTRQWGYPVSLFDACNAISALKYEGEPGIGTMVIAEVDHPDVELVVQLSSRVPLTDHRGTRKLLQMATGHMCLLSDAGYIYGLGRCSEADSGTNGVIRIDFTGHYAWEVVHRSRTLMKVVYGQPQLPGKAFSLNQFRESVGRIFQGISDSEVETLLEIVLEATHQPKGTLIVITTGARTEAMRLHNQCIQTKPMVPSPDVVRTITSIDGAVMLDPHGTCYAIGVILDGLTSGNGNPMRGSRFNSALRYVETSRKQFGYACYAVVVSEDGMVDLLPDMVLQQEARNGEVRNDRQTSPPTSAVISEQVRPVQPPAQTAPPPVLVKIPFDTNGADEQEDMILTREEVKSLIEWVGDNYSSLAPDLVSEINRRIGHAKEQTDTPPENTKGSASGTIIPRLSAPGNGFGPAQIPA